MTRTRDPRISWPLAGVLVLALLLAFAPTRPALAAGADIEAEFVSLVNRERSARGLAPLQVSAELTRVARQHTARMTSQQRLHHSPDLGAAVGNWSKLGENVGRGGRAGAISNAFLRSESHRRNILDREWLEIGVGVELRDGVVWVTQIYRVPQRPTR